MRIIEGTVNAGGFDYPFELTCPDEVVFCYNPLFMEIAINQASKISAITIRFSSTGLNVGTREIKACLYMGRARVFYSRILELFFNNVKSERVKVVSVEIYNGQTQICKFSHTVIWGAIAIGERFESYGVFKYNATRPYMERNRIWFRNFPFTVTLFQSEASGQNKYLKAKYDDKPYDDNLMLYSPMFTMMAPFGRISFQGNPDDVCPTGKSLDEIWYAPDKKRFYGLYDQNHICGTWNSQLPYFYDSSFYNGLDGKARSDLKWGWSGDHSFYHFDKQTDRLIKSDYGFFGDFGLFELVPEFTFPDAKINATYRQENPKERSRTSLFDDTFDYTFFNSNEFATITNLIINYETAGYYLRWIDRFGCFQYYLFKSGEATIKNKLSGNTFVEMAVNDGMWFPNHIRDINITATDTRKCQASSLEDSIFAYVSTIITSPIIDLYLGKTKLGKEIWVPINIVASSHKYKPKDVLHNLEISFTMPDIQAQSL